ncbi:MAG: hypothetical protein AB1483_05800 [Candidatus Zixiibacteriota bacterium]
MLPEVEQAFLNAILAELPSNGDTVGNWTLIKKLKSDGLSEQDYWHLQDKLVQSGRVKKGRGKGGSLALVLDASTTNSTKTEGDTAAPESTVPEDTELKIDRQKRKSLAKFILGEVPSNGSTVSNQWLIAKAKKNGFTEDEYWFVRNELIDNGTLGKARGKGGTIYLVAGTAKTAEKRTKKKYAKEKSLYKPCHDVIMGFWIKDAGLDPRKCVTQVTANQGGRKTGGKWTRPDITVISVRTYEFIPGKILDVTTFEIKPANDLDVKGVFEAASHSRFAHKSYLAVHLPDGKKESDDFKNLQKECERFGVGFIYFEKSDDWTTWEIVTDPDRKNPAPEEVDRFISTQMSKENQKDIHEFLK